MNKDCPVCGRGPASLYWERVWGDPGLRVMACTGCGLFFLDKNRSAQVQKDFDQGYDRYIAARAQMVAAHSDADFDAAVDHSIEERFADIGDLFSGSVRALEVGAERGGFLDRLKARVPELTAVDSCPDYQGTLKAKGYAAYLYIDDVPEEARFDRICLFSLLEHIQEPVPFMAALARRLAPGGKIVIEVPSASEPLVSLYDIPAFKSFYFQAMHPFVFSLKALDIVLEKAGLRRTSVRFKQRYGLANHLQWLKAGLPGGSTAYEALFSGDADAAYRRTLEARGITDTLYLIATLPADA